MAIKGSHKVIGGGAGALLALAIALPFQQREEGEPRFDAQGYTWAFEDPVYGWQIPTACWGDTGRHVTRESKFTRDDCLSMLHARDAELLPRVLDCIAEGRQITPFVLAMFISQADNVGISKVCRSTMMRQINAGQPPEIYCRQLTEATANFVPFGAPVKKDAAGRVTNAIAVPGHGWVVANNRSCRDRRNRCYGLVLRREREQALCLGDAARLQQEGIVLPPLPSSP